MYGDKRRINLIGTQEGNVSSSDLLDVVLTYCNTHSNANEKCVILFDDLPEMKTIINSLKKVENVYSHFHLVKREGIISQQVMKYSAVINRDLFYVDESFLVESDLVFDDLSLSNLVDPIYSDEQTIFPLTQSLLIACHYLEKPPLRYTSHASTKRLKDSSHDDRRSVTDYFRRH